MNLGKTLSDLATAPVRVGLAVADAGLEVANSALGRARSGSGSVTHMLGIDDAVERANRLARLMDEDQPLGRALAPGGPVDRLPQPGGGGGWFAPRGVGGWTGCPRRTAA